MYTTNFIYKAPPAVLESLKKLFSILHIENINFEQAALVAENRQLKDTLFQFLQESNQYLHELKCQIESLGGEVLADSFMDENDTMQIENIKDIYEYCSKCENRILSAYRDILNQSIIVKELRSMVRYQLNGLLCSFLQFRLLRDSFRRF